MDSEGATIPGGNRIGTGARGQRGQWWHAADRPTEKEVCVFFAVAGDREAEVRPQEARGGSAMKLTLGRLLLPAQRAPPACPDPPARPCAQYTTSVSFYEIAMALGSPHHTTMESRLLTNHGGVN